MTAAPGAGALLRLREASRGGDAADIAAARVLLFGLICMITAMLAGPAARGHAAPSVSSAASVNAAAAPRATWLCGAPRAPGLLGVEACDHCLACAAATTAAAPASVAPLRLAQRAAPVQRAPASLRPAALLQRRARAPPPRA